MKAVAHIVACHDEDILPFSVAQAARQFDRVIVALGKSWWCGFDATVGLEAQHQVLALTCLVHGLDNVDVIEDHYPDQPEHRTACVERAREMGYIEDGDLLALIDADELWRHDALADVIEAFRRHKDLQAMAVPCAEFWDWNRVRCGAGSEDKPLHGLVPRMRFWRYADGCYFKGNNALAYRSGGLYPHHTKGDKSARHTHHVCGKPRALHHYEATRPAWRMKLKHDAFEHRRKKRGDNRLRENFHDVWRRWQDGPEAVEAEPYGISTESTYKIVTKQVVPQHPSCMAYYAPLVRCGRVGAKWPS